MRSASRLALLLLALSAGGCQAFIAGVSAPSIMKQDRVNLLNATYASADTLASQSQRQLPVERPLTVMALKEILPASKDPPRANAHLGAILTAQYRDRFTQLGYVVVPDGRAPGADGGVLSGSYEIRDGRMTVITRIVNRRTGRIAASDSYSLPVTYDIKKYMSRGPNDLPVIEPIF